MRRFYTLMVFWIVSASATLIAEERTVREKQLSDAFSRNYQSLFIAEQYRGSIVR